MTIETPQETPAPRVVADDETHREIERLLQVRAQKEALEAEEADIVAWLNSRIADSVWTEHDGKQTRVTVSRREGTWRVDLPKLQATDPALYAQITATETVLNRAAFNDARKLYGLFNPGTPAATCLKQDKSSVSVMVKSFDDTIADAV